MSRLIITVLLFATLLGACSKPLPPFEHGLTSRDIAFLQTFSLDKLPPLPSAADNQYADNEQAALLGKQLFFDARLSANGAISCASCHQPARYFTDGLASGEGMALTHRNTMSLLASARGPWKYWDGRKDSLWAQASEPLEHPDEHGFSREKLDALIREHYVDSYAEVFGSISNEQHTATRVMVNVAKALMAYQRRLTLQPSKFDQMVSALAKGEQPSLTARLSVNELNGMRMFMGKAACASCHNGPLFTNFEFHNIGAPEADVSKVDLGRYAGIEKLRDDEFNCLSQWSDAPPASCQELRFLKTQGPELVGAFKTPSLRNVAETAPYMHAGQIKTLEDVVEHYSAPKPPFYDRAQHPSRPHFDILPLGLSAQEKSELVAFLKTLSSPIPNDDPWWTSQ
ncbi:MAG: cytochrome-c peroxidase [Pseudomonadales bacterium]